MRTYVISNIRKAASEIFPIDAKQEVYATRYNRSQVPAIVTLLRNPNKPSEAYPRYCSVLYKDGVIRGSGIFGGVAILNVSRPLFLSAISEHFPRYSRRSSLAQHHSAVLLGQLVQGQGPLQFVQVSSQSLLGWLPWPQLW